MNSLGKAVCARSHLVSNLITALTVGCILYFSECAIAEQNEAKVRLAREFKQLYEKEVFDKKKFRGLLVIPTKYKADPAERKFYLAGFVRGLIDSSTYDGFKEALSLNHHQNLNSGLKAVEFKGWLAGSKKGFEVGKKIEKKIQEKILLELEAGK